MVCTSQLAHGHRLVTCKLKAHDADDEGQILHLAACPDCPDGTARWASEADEGA